MPTVLVADDQPTNREFLATLLSYAGHQLLEAADGAEALALARSKHPDLVIADVLMPVMDGYEFVRQLRNDPQTSDTPVVFYTAGYHEREARALAESCGVRYVLSKPAKPDEILSVVAQVLHGGKKQDTAPLSGEFDREHLRLVTDKLSMNVKALETANQRLSDLLDVSRLLASELDSEKLLAKFCAATRELVGARFAFIGLLSESDHLLKPLFTSGMDSEKASSISALRADRGILVRLAAQSTPLRAADVAGDAPAEVLPPSYLSRRSFLGMQLTTSAGPYGLLWLLEKLGGDEFGEEDERVLVSLAAQAGVAYENARFATQLERRIEERTAELTNANKELEAFTYSVSHDLRAPLRHIKGFAEILAQDYGAQMEPRLRESLDRIREGTQRMAELVEDLLRLSQFGRTDLRWQVTALDSVLSEVLQELKSETEGRDIEWKIGALPQVNCDAALMKQVFVNLLSNALKYTRPRARPVIQVGILQEDPIPTLFVRDNGVGFDMRYADKLFGIFQRLHRSEDFEGTGAGLAIVQRILNRHHGRIWAEAEPERGATFYFTIGSGPKTDSLSKCQTPNVELFPLHIFRHE
jgi:signal transduction histidine kinase/CheY-like chemotaxis protein